VNFWKDMCYEVRLYSDEPLASGVTGYGGASVPERWMVWRGIVEDMCHERRRAEACVD
jgi:hypothetical protein